MLPNDMFMHGYSHRECTRGHVDSDTFKYVDVSGTTTETGQGIGYEHGLGHWHGPEHRHWPIYTATDMSKISETDTDKIADNRTRPRHGHWNGNGHGQRTWTQTRTRPQTPTWKQQQKQALSQTRSNTRHRNEHGHGHWHGNSNGIGHCHELGHGHRNGQLVVDTVTVNHTYIEMNTNSAEDMFTDIATDTDTAANRNGQKLSWAGRVQTPWNSGNATGWTCRY